MSVDLIRSQFLSARPFVVGVAAVAAIGGFAVSAATGWRLGALWLVGIALGFALHRAGFGFSAGFRVLLREGKSAQVRAQILMLGAAVVLFFPALAFGTVLGAPVRGFVMPAGVGVALGALLFGVGMQLSGGCISGTLYTVGGGSTRMMVTLAFAVVGATLAAFYAELWSDLPALPPLSLLSELGLAPALALHLAVFVLAWVALAAIERRRHGAVQAVWRRSGSSLLQGVWPYAWAALALALLNFATLLLAGRPWGISQAFALWGSQALDRLGLADPVFWPFWEDPTRAEAVHRALWRDTTTVMTVGIVVGGALAAGVAGSFATTLHVPLRHLVASAIGGVLLGAGAIVATGCNISAFFSGIASGSLHGWLWIAAALPGNWLGVQLRGLFALDGPAAAARAHHSPITSRI
ncbi:hypothetical protein BVIRIDIS_15120 [Blastochloris viridis]|uniref:Uncharacterized protein n=1 Tax=Blastochloris viridis TaxID=1079 RepID=A0A0S4Q1W6_BLAVI|nr:hypothetical protein BVIRIDIS_15120 [Blastochloris viridis]